VIKMYAMRVWVDVTNSPHVLFFRPLVALLEQRGHEVTVTTREYAQTLELLERHDIPFELVGPRHGGASAIGKARAMAGRLPALVGFARRRRFDLALSHASHELPLAARLLGIPSAYAFDYELARLQHGIGCRAASRIVVPAAIPQARLRALGARSRKVARFEGLKEEYYLADFEPDRSALDTLGLDRTRVLVVVRTPPDVSAYHRHGNPLFTDALRRLGEDPAVHAVALPRTREQRAELQRLRLPSLVVPDSAVDGPSLVALADLVVSAGGTMNREAAALGVPVYTLFAGRVGAVDEALLAQGRLRRLGAVADIELRKRGPASEPIRRNPAVLLDLMLAARGA
jgi:predicted glycosyltransferase